MKEIIETLKQKTKEQRYYESMMEVLYCDHWHALPKDGYAYMDEVQGFLMKEKQQHFSLEIKALLQDESLQDMSIYNIYERGMVKFLRKKQEEMEKIPFELQVELQKLCSEAQSVWQIAYKENDAMMFLPYVEKQFALQKKIAQALDPTRPAYEVLINRFDPGYTLEELDEIFMVLKTEIKKIQQEVSTSQTKTEILQVDPPYAVKKALAQHAIDLLHVDKHKTTFYEVQHPVCVCVGPNDARPSSNYTNVWKGIFALLHECGHAMYSYNSNTQAIQHGLWGGVDGSLHESQSRFYENIIGRSYTFWEHFYPNVQEAIPALRDVALSDVYQALNDTTPSCIRLQANELTSILHIIIRYEMEKAYFANEIEIKDFPEHWNRKYQEYLGVTPATMQEGILQDVHWASGHVGYFQSYALGDLYAAMFWEAIQNDIPNVEEQLKQGDYMIINDWLNEHVHQYGQCMEAKEILQQACGKSVDPYVYIQYLRKKFLP